MDLSRRLLSLFTTPFTKSRCQWVADSECGEREENQDNYLLITPDGASVCLQQQGESNTVLSSWSSHYFRLAIADGMGGHNDGRQIAEALMQKLQKLQKLQQLAPQNEPQSLRNKIYDLHQQLWLEYSQTSRKSPGTTLVMADIKDNGCTIIANIGDSRAYLWRDNKWQQLTYDQNINEYDWRDDELENEEDYHPNHKNHQIAQAMGCGSYGLLTNKYGYRVLRFNPKLRLDLTEDLKPDKKHPDIFKLYLQKGDALLLASDGLWSVEKYVSPIEIPKPSQIATKEDLRTFLGKARNNGCRDNITAVVLWAK